MPAAAAAADTSEARRSTYELKSRSLANVGRPYRPRSPLYRGKKVMEKLRVARAV